MQCKSKYENENRTGASQKWRVRWNQVRHRGGILGGGGKKKKRKERSTKSRGTGNGKIIKSGMWGALGENLL